jgi:transcriptional regulator with XRE-family HTH domain
MRRRREELDLSLREFAKRLDCSAAFISDIELGRRHPSEKVLAEIARVLKVKLEELQAMDVRPPIDGFRVIGHLTFIKRYASTERFLRYQHENAYLLAKGNPQKPARTIPDVLEWKYTGNNLHPTQKPVSVLTPLVESFSNPGDVVLDPFCGSGSTLLAARNLNRRFVGIELSKRYFDLAEQRLRQCRPAQVASAC